MKHHAYHLLMTLLTLILTCSLLLACMPAATAAEPNLITSVDELVSALANANDGDTILVGDITFKPMPMGIIVVPQNVTIRSGKDTNAVFTNATFGLNGTTADSAPLTVRFENIDFRGDKANAVLDPNAPPTISSQMPGLMKTMCAAICKMNVDATYSGCTFAGYHYGYGGVFSAIYSSDDNQNALHLTLNGCTFWNNVSKFGGSIYLSGYNHNINLNARHCVFDDNAATTGGAIWAQDANIRLLDCSLVGNQYLNAEVDSPNGGALALYNCGVDLDGCLIANNTSGGDGAGVFCEISPFKTLIMENCTVIGEWLFVAEGEGKYHFEFKDSWLRGAGEDKEAKEFDSLEKEVASWFTFAADESYDEWATFYFDGFYLETKDPQGYDGHYMMVCPKGDYASYEDADAVDLTYCYAGEKCPYRFSFEQWNIENGEYTIVIAQMGGDVEVKFDAEKKGDKDWKLDFSNAKCPKLDSKYPG